MPADLFTVEPHLAVLARSSGPWRGRNVPLATPPGTRYPYVYPRDLAGSARAFDGLHRRGIESKRVFEALAAAAAFVAHAQAPDGSWTQRYRLDGTDAGIYRQEDNVAHGMIALGLYAQAARRQGEAVEVDVLTHMERAYRHARAVNFRPGVNLFYSTTTIHESAIEEGYTIWNNFAHRRAFELYRRVLEEAGDPREGEVRTFLDMLDANLARHFVVEGGLARRVTPLGRHDRRPDITLLAPYYFDAQDVVGGALDTAAQRVERELWDPDLGLVSRYLPFTEDPTVHAHGGHGPWIQYSCILAQYHARRGSRARGREILRLVAERAVNGELPEHLTTRERFVDFWEREWQTGRDFEKEFAPTILRHDVPFGRVVEELVHMRDEYARLRARVDAGEEVLAFAAPLAWSHAEFLEALLLLERR